MVVFYGIAAVSIVVSNLILIGLMTYVYFKGDDDDFAH